MHHRVQHQSWAERFGASCSPPSTRQVLGHIPGDGSSEGPQWGSPACSCHGDLVCSPPRLPAAASCLQQPQVVGFKPGAIPLRASTPPDDKNSAKPQIHPQTSPAMGTHIQDCHIHWKPLRLTLLATKQVKNGANPCGDRDRARLCPPGRRHPAPHSALGLPQLAPGDGGEQRAGSEQGVSGGV